MRVSVSTGSINSNQRQQVDDQWLIFLTISGGGTPVRVVNDSATVGGQPAKYIWEGDEFIAFPFEIELLTDDDQAPTGRLSVQNVDRRIGQMVRALGGAPELKIQLIPASEFDLTVNPRTALPGAEVEYLAENLFLRDVSVDAMTVSGTITSWDYTQELWPGLRATQNRLPGLYR